jgi:hypothetical protein
VPGRTSEPEVQTSLTLPRPNSHVAKGHWDSFGDRKAPVCSSTPFGEAKKSTEIFLALCFDWRLK